MPKRAIRNQALIIALSTVPFALAFGVACREAGLRWWEAAGFSTIVFGGSAQFAAVGVLADGGTVAAAIAAGALLSLRALAFGVLLAPTLTGPSWFRALSSQWMIDESTAVAVAQSDPALRRYGYLSAGLAVFVLWNLGTLVGFLAATSLGDKIRSWGLDATIPAAFLAMLWPRLQQPPLRRIAFIGLAIAAATVPFTPPGIPIVLAAGAILFARGRTW
jgi:predicted branched-subunit amino acid permease